MTSAASLSHNNSIDQLPLARLYAQEEIFILPLREYLESHGCSVVLNHAGSEQETYLIIAGSAQFVKNIIASIQSPALRKLAIVITSDLSDGQKILSDLYKIIVIDPRYLSENDVEKIFAFFFSGSGQVLNITRNIHEPFVQPVSAPVDALSYDNDLGLVPATNIVEQHGVYPSTNSQVDTVLPTEDSKRIRQIMTDVFGDSRVNRKKKHTSHRIKKMKESLISFLLFLIFSLGVLIFPLFTYLASVGASAFFLVQASHSIGRFDMSGANNSLKRSDYWLGQSEFLLSVISIPFDIVQFDMPIRGQERLVSLLRDLNTGILQSIAVSSAGKEFMLASIPSSIREDARLPASSLESLRTSISAAHDTLGLAQAELSLLLRDRTFPFSINSIYIACTAASSKLEHSRKLLSFAQDVLMVYPKIAGFKVPQTFLVLLQNSNELRPTGGFIGSVGLATFENGTMSDFSIEDVYALDGQLKGHVDPPKPISELLGNEHWYLRDSNWDPDFRESGAKAIWFYEKETGKHIDGIFAVNVPVLVSILSAIGPIQLPDYNDRITKDNFFGKSVYYTQNNFFPGSTQKRDFLGALSRAIMTKIMTDKDVDGVALIKAIQKGIEQRDIVMHLPHTEIQTMIEHFGWGGRVFANTLCTGVDIERCLQDEILVSEANLSVSKVNYYITHNAAREITITTHGEVNERITYTIGNTVNAVSNQNEKGVGGPYLSYVRFVLPKDSIVNSVLVDGVAVASRGISQKTATEMPYIENTDGTGDHRGIGIALRVNPGERKEIQFSYARTAGLHIGKGGAYLDLLWYKHPGISSMPLQTTVRFPQSWRASPLLLPSDASDGAFIAKEAEFEYNTLIERDTNYRIKFIQ